MIAAGELARGLNITVNPYPDEITMFVIAKEFHWTFDQIKSMSAKDFKALTTMLSVYNKVQNQEMERNKNKRR